MGFNDRLDNELNENLETAIEYLDEGTPAHGIARQVQERGLETLSEAQRGVYDRIVLPAMARGARRAEEAELRRRIEED